MSIAPLLTSELELGQKLNHSVKAGEHANFALLLAMLSKDVTEQSQFQFEHQPLANNTNETDAFLDSLSVPPTQDLKAESVEQELHSLKLGQMAQDQGMLSARLSHCLNPEALSYTLEQTQGIDTQVFDNLDKRVAQRFSGIDQLIALNDIELTQVLEQQRDYSAQLI